MAPSRATNLAEFPIPTTLKVDGVNSRVGIGSTIPETTLDVGGIVSCTGDINANGNIVGDNATNITGINNINATAFFGSGANLTDVISGVELKDDGSSVGTSVTAINFSGFTVTPVVPSGAHAGLSTVSLAQSFSVGTRTTPVTISIAGGSFTITGRSTNTVITV